MERVTVWRLSNGELFEGDEARAAEKEVDITKSAEATALFKFLDEFVCEYASMPDEIEDYVSAESILESIVVAAPTLTKAALECLND